MAYGRTFLQLVNDVLRELREPEATTWNESDYSTLIGQFVNSCKRDAENAWRWTALRTDITVPAVQGTSLYSLTGTDERAQVLDAWNTTNGVQLGKRTWRSDNEVRFSQPAPEQGDVTSWTPMGVDTNGVYRVRVHPVPDSAQTLVFSTYVPQPDMAANGTVMLVPHRPVVEGALARARFERGEDGGVGFDGQAKYMAHALADHIALDAAQQSDDVEWVAV